MMEPPQWRLLFNREAISLLGECASAHGVSVKSFLTNRIDDAIEGRLDLGWYAGRPAAEIRRLSLVFTGETRTPNALSGAVCEVHLNEPAQHRIAVFCAGSPGKSDAEVLRDRLGGWLARELICWSDRGCKLDRVEPILGNG